ncbi:MAG: tyrosine-type recombinase/integrase [Pseudomonadota bacterium]
MPSLKIEKRGSVYYASGTVAGRRIRQSLRTGDRATAKEQAAILEARLWKRHSYGEEAVRTFEEAALSYLEAGGERRFMAPLLTHFRGHKLADIHPEDVRQAARVIYSNAKASTRNRQAIVPAQAVINHAHGKGWCQLLRVEKFSEGTPLRKHASEEWLDRFIRQALADDLPHLAALVIFMADTAARVSEALRVTGDDLDLRKATVIFGRTKTGEHQTAALTPTTVAALANLAPFGDGPVFRYRSRSAVNARIKAVCRRAGIEYLSSHKCGRHSFGRRAMQRGTSVPDAME